MVTKKFRKLIIFQYTIIIIYVISSKFCAFSDGLIVYFLSEVLNNPSDKGIMDSVEINKFNTAWGTFIISTFEISIELVKHASLLLSISFSSLLPIFGSNFFLLLRTAFASSSFFRYFAYVVAIFAQQVL